MKLPSVCLEQTKKKRLKQAKKIRATVEKEMKGTGVTMSIGAVVYEKGLSMDLITKRADEAMYLAKKKETM